MSLLVPNFKVKKLYPDAKLPQKANSTDSGFDVFAYSFIRYYTLEGACSNKIDPNKVILKTNDRILINTGLSVSVDPGFEIQVRSRSGLALKSGLMVTNSPGTIDCSYRGPLCIIMSNIGHNDYGIKLEDKIAQIVVCPVCLPSMFVVDDLDDTIRGSDGFGSTDKDKY